PRPVRLVFVQVAEQRPAPPQLPPPLDAARHRDGDRSVGNSGHVLFDIEADDAPILRRTRDAPKHGIEAVEGGRDWPRSEVTDVARRCAEPQAASIACRGTRDGEVLPDEHRQDRLAQVVEVGLLLASRRADEPEIEADAECDWGGWCGGDGSSERLFPRLL